MNSVYPFCGASAADIHQTQMGATTVRAYRPAAVVFTDAVVLLYPPVSGRLLNAAVSVAAGFIGGTKHGSDLAAELNGGSAERRVERVNEVLRKLIYKKFRLETITAADVVGEFGDWAHGWPNSSVVSVTMKRKGLIFKYWEIILKPESGLSMRWRCSTRNFRPPPSRCSEKHSDRGSPWSASSYQSLLINSDPVAGQMGQRGILAIAQIGLVPRQATSFW